MITLTEEKLLEMLREAALRGTHHDPDPFDLVPTTIEGALCTDVAELKEATEREGDDVRTASLITWIESNRTVREMVHAAVRKVMSVVDTPADIGQDLNAEVEGTLYAMLTPPGRVDWTVLAEHFIEASREPQRPDAVLADGRLTCPECGGPVRLREDGYCRDWTTEVNADGQLYAYHGGSEDFSEDGDGDLYLVCTYLHESDVPDGLEVNWA